MPSKYLNDARTGELIQKIYTADRAIATECKSYTDTNYLPLTGGTITGNLTVSGTITGDVTGDLTGNADSATNDANGNPIASTYLPLSGGTMTGSIVNNTGADGIILGESGNTGSVNMSGGETLSATDGAKLDLFGASHATYPGEAILQAGDGNGYKQLRCKPDGSLTWGGVSLSDGTFLTTRQVTLSVTSSTSNGANVNAPAVSGYQFVCWVMSQSSGNVYATYIQNATSSTGRVWWVYSSGTPGGTSIVCTALYVRKW